MRDEQLFELPSFSSQLMEGEGFTLLYPHGKIPARDERDEVDDDYYYDDNDEFDYDDDGNVIISTLSSMFPFIIIIILYI